MSAESTFCLCLNCIFQASGQISQRVHLATRAFSATVAQAMATYMPHRALQAGVVRTVDAWFDTLNSHSANNAKPERCGYGVNAASLERQDAALSSMDLLTRQVRKVTEKQPTGRATLLPCRHGVIRVIASLRGLYSESVTCRDPAQTSGT